IRQKQMPIVTSCHLDMDCAGSISASNAYVIELNILSDNLCERPAHSHYASQIVLRKSTLTICCAFIQQRHAIQGVDFVGAGDAHAKIIEQAIADIVYPAVNIQRLPALPCAL